MDVRFQEVTAQVAPESAPTAPSSGGQRPQGSQPLEPRPVLEVMAQQQRRQARLRAY